MSRQHAARLPVTGRPAYAMWGNYVRLLACLCAVFLCGQLGLSAREQLLYRDLVSFHLQDSPLTFDTYQTIANTETRSGRHTPFALWVQSEQQIVEEVLTKRSHSVAALSVCGDTRLVLPFSAVLDAGDFTGCLIDKKTAHALFGTQNAAGSVLHYNGVEYVVRDVFDAPANTLVLQFAPGTQISLDHVSVLDPDTVSTFPLRHNLAVQSTLHASAYETAARLIGSLPFAVLSLMILEFLFRLQLRHRHYPVRHCLFFVLFLAALSISFILLLGALPNSWTPSRWSDFSFWKERFLQWKTDAVRYFISPKYRQDLLLLHHILTCFWGIVSASLLLPLRRFVYNNLF